MTLRDYKELLDKVVATNPEYLDLPVVYSVDFAGTKFKLLRAFPFAKSKWMLDNEEVESVCVN